MKPRPILLAYVLIAGGTLLIIMRANRDSDPSQVGTSELLEPPSAQGNASQRESLDSLTGPSGRQQVETAETNREKAPSQASAEGSALESDHEAVTRRNRELMLKVREEKIKAQMEKRSVLIADQLGLGTDAHLKILQVYLMERKKIEIIREEYARALNKAANLKMRGELAALKDWRRGRWESLFGAQAAEAIEGFSEYAIIESQGFDPADYNIKQDKDE